LDLDTPVDYSILPGFVSQPFPLEPNYYLYPREVQFYNTSWEVESIPHLIDQSTIHTSTAKVKFSGLNINPGDVLVARVVYTGMGLHMTALYGGDDTVDGLTEDFGKAILPTAEEIGEYYQVITIPQDVLPNRDYVELNLATGNYNSFSGRFEGRFLGNVLLRSVSLVQREGGMLLGVYSAYRFESNPGIRKLSTLTDEDRTISGLHVDMDNMAELSEEGLTLDDSSSKAASIYMISFSGISIGPGAGFLVAVRHRGSGLNSFFILDGTEAEDGIRREYGFGTLPSSEDWKRTIYPMTYPMESVSDVDSIRLVLSIGAYDRRARSYNRDVRGNSEVSEIALIEEKSGRVVAYWYPGHPDLQFDEDEAAESADIDISNSEVD
jgi:hypothetical protein